MAARARVSTGRRVNDVLKRPLVFGDAEQIAALKAQCRKMFWDALERCETCDGNGECERCGRECEDCETFGLTTESLEKFQKEFPGFRTWNQTW
jgi:hypothetical protein